MVYRAGMNADITFRVGAAALGFVALGFGIPAVIGAVHFARTGSVWQLWGFPSYDTSLFMQWGVRFPPVALMAAFGAVCALATVDAVLLAAAPSAPIGVVAAIAGLVLIAAQCIFWIGFRLPFGPPFGVIAAIAIVAGLVMRTR
jgi:hypothetical protein